MEPCFVSCHQPAFKPYNPETEVKMSLESANHSRVVMTANSPVQDTKAEIIREKLLFSVYKWL